MLEPLAKASPLTMLENDYRNIIVSGKLYALVLIMFRIIALDDEVNVRILGTLKLSLKKFSLFLCFCFCHKALIICLLFSNFCSVLHLYSDSDHISTDGYFVLVECIDYHPTQSGEIKTVK